MDQQVLWIVAALAGGSLIGVFWRMSGGFGPMNLRAVGIVLIAALASVLAVGKAETITAAMGILGTIAGYLFGAKSTKSEEASASVHSSVNAKNTNYGDNAKVAGRDINETVNKIEKMLGDVQSMTNATVQNLQLLNNAAKFSLKRKRRESIRWEHPSPSLRRQLEELSKSRTDSWSQDWIDLCLNDESCLAAIRQFIQINGESGWRAADIDFDNTQDGLHVNFTFERDIPGLEKP